MVVFYSYSSYVTRGKLLHPCFWWFGIKFGMKFGMTCIFSGFCDESCLKKVVHLCIWEYLGMIDGAYVEVLSAAESCGGPNNSPFFWFWIIKKVLHACSHMLTQKKEGHGMSQSGSSSATLRMSTQFHSSLGRGGIGRRTDWAPANSTSRNTTRDEYNGAQHTACHRKKKHPAEMVKPRTLAPSTFQQVFGGSYFDLVPLGASDSNSFSLFAIWHKNEPILRI